MSEKFKLLEAADEKFTLLDSRMSLHEMVQVAMYMDYIPNLAFELIMAELMNDEELLVEHIETAMNDLGIE